MSDAPAIIAALAGAITTASNDDTSAPSTEQRSRHVERIGAMGDAAEFIAAQEARLASALAALDDARVALEWYGEQTRICRLIHSGGDAGRHSLADDGGKCARTAIARIDALKGETDV